MKRVYLETLRVERGLTKAFMGKELQITPEYYSYIENGERLPDMTLSIANGLAKILKVSVAKINQCEQEWLKESEVN